MYGPVDSCPATVIVTCSGNVASQCLSKLYMKLECKHLLIMRLSGEASFEAKDKVIHWLMLIHLVHDCIYNTLSI